MLATVRRIDRTTLAQRLADKAELRAKRNRYYWRLMKWSVILLFLCCALAYALAHLIILYWRMTGQIPW